MESKTEASGLEFGSLGERVLLRVGDNSGVGRIESATTNYCTKHEAETFLIGVRLDKLNGNHVPVSVRTTHIVCLACAAHSNGEAEITLL